MTGSLPRTSASYIFFIPSFTLAHDLTAVISSSMGECQRSEAVLIELMKDIHDKYMYLSAKASIISGSCMDFGLRCLCAASQFRAYLAQH